MKPKNINNNALKDKISKAFSHSHLCTPSTLSSSVFYLLDPVVLTIVLFHSDPPIPTALQPDICLEPPYMGPCKAKIIRHFYNAKSRFWETFVYDS